MLLEFRIRLLSLMLLPVVLTVCYKEKLEEFRKVEFKGEREMAFPLFESTLVLEDSLPFSIPAITLADTVSVDFTAANYLGDYSGDLTYVECKVVLKNNFPITGRFQLYVTDEKGQLIDSLFNFQTTVMETQGNGAYTETTVLLYMDLAKYERIKHASKIFVLYQLNSKPTAAYASNKLSIHSGIKFGITF